MTIKANLERGESKVDNQTHGEFLLLEAKRSFDLGEIDAGIVHLGQAAYVLSKGDHQLSTVYVGVLVNRVTSAGVLAAKTC